MKRKRIRVYFLQGFSPNYNFIDLFGMSLETINKLMAVENEEMVTITTPQDNCYIWRRKHIDDWKEIEE